MSDERMIDPFEPVREEAALYEVRDWKRIDTNHQNALIRNMEELITDMVAEINQGLAAGIDMAWRRGQLDAYIAARDLLHKSR